MKGFATAEGTVAYQGRFKDKLHKDHFRQTNGLWFSSLGIGSYLGQTDAHTDKLYETALKEAVNSGINVIDSAINYRNQRSERAFGRALAELFQAGQVKREELILCTKGGFIPFDSDIPENPETYFQKTYLDTGILKPGDIAQGCHAMAPAYLQDQLDRSLKNWGVDCLDIYYLHNPETQLGDVDRPEFSNRMRAAFAWLEEKVSEGKIRMYGTATWNGYRVGRESEDYLSLEELLVLAREAGGPQHHFKVVQLPFSLAMPEAWVFANQRFGANDVPFLVSAARYGMTVIGSASLLQSKLAGPLPEFLNNHFKNLSKSAQRSLQFARSVTGMTTSLIGMKNQEHVRENLEVAKVPALTENELLLMFQQTP